jgi:hypothetical protein
LQLDQLRLQAQQSPEIDPAIERGWMLFL